MIKCDLYSMYRSLVYFVKLFFVKKKYDVVFVSSNDLNRGEGGVNLFFKPFLETCNKNNMNYVVFEDTDLKGAFNHYPRDRNSIPLDFIVLIRSVLRNYFKILHKSKEGSGYKNFYENEIQIAKVLQGNLFRKLDYKTCIYVPGDMGIFWHGINPTASYYELQHGVIANNHVSYLVNNEASIVAKTKNDALLVFGKGFQDLLIQQDKTNYYNYQNVITIGQSISINNTVKEKKNQKIILFSLQITNEHPYEISLSIIKVIKDLLEFNKVFLQDGEYKIIFKQHPRYNINKCPPIEFKYPFVSFADNSLTLAELLEMSSFHCTFHSTVTFDAALHSVPTLLLNHKEISNSIFFEEYKYPLNDFNIVKANDFEQVLKKLENSNYYSQCCIDAYKWARYFYDEYDEQKFIDIISGGQ